MPQEQKRNYADQELDDKICLLLGLHFGRLGVSKNHKLIEDLDADSLDIVEVGMLMEEEFNFEAPDIDVINFKTVNDIVEFVRKKH